MYNCGSKNRFALSLSKVIIFKHSSRGEYIIYKRERKGEEGRERKSGKREIERDKGGYYNDGERRNECILHRLNREKEDIEGRKGRE